MDDSDASPRSIAAASVFYKDGKYWLLTEYNDDGVWKISAFYSERRDSGFTYVEDILLLDEACPIALGSPEGSVIYLYVSRREDSVYWRADSRKLSTDN